MTSDVKYESRGGTASDQAEATTVNPTAGNVQMRILVELQVIAYLLANSAAPGEDLHQLRQTIADTIS